MNLLNKILLGLVAVAILPFLVFAARTLKTHEGWMTEIPKYEKQITAELDQQKILKFGDPKDPTKPGVRKLNVALHKELLDRGALWSNCDKDSDSPDGGMIVNINDPDPTLPLQNVQDNIASKEILFVFEDQVGGNYLGEFKVAGVNQKKVTLTPALKLTSDEIKNIQNARGKLMLTDIMPIDRHGLFAGKDEAFIRQHMPKAPDNVISQYVRDGQPKADDDDPDMVQDGKFVRPLYDFATLFHYYHHQLSVLSDTQIKVDAELTGVKNDVMYLDAQIKKTDAQIVELTKEFARVKAEREVASAHFKAVEERLAAVQAEVEKTLDANRKLGAQWTAIQTEAARRINEATAAASAGAGRKP
jgi:hypothetical protein